MVRVERLQILHLYIFRQHSAWEVSPNILGPTWGTASGDLGPQSRVLVEVLKLLRVRVGESLGKRFTCQGHAVPVGKLSTTVWPSFNNKHRVLFLVLMSCRLMSIHSSVWRKVVPRILLFRTGCSEKLGSHTQPLALAKPSLWLLGRDSF